MNSRLTLRLDKETRERIARIARRRQISVSQMIREAIKGWVVCQDSHSCYEKAADLIGIVHGGDSKRSTATVSLRNRLKHRRSRA